MKFCFNTTGSNQPVIREFDIDKDLCVNEGQVVCISNSKVTDAIKGQVALGVCAETHSGNSDLLNVRANGTKVRVVVGADSVYEAKMPKLCATSKGTSTSFICSADGLGSNVKGYLMLTGKSSDSQNTDEIGKVRRIVSCTVSGSTATFTLEAGGIIYTGDEYVLIPDLACTMVLDNTKTGVVFANANTDITFKVIGNDTNRLTTFVTMQNTLFA